jgi:GDP-L-fucose synthase
MDSLLFDKAGLSLITGSNGMVGSALVNTLRKQGYERLLFPSRQELELQDTKQVNDYFAKHRPDYVFMIAAKVGGIAANQADPVGFISENLSIQLNLFEACYKYKTLKNLFLGSSCMYPRECPQPMKEDYLLTGPLEDTNEGYALAKIMGVKTANYYYKQYGMVTVCPIACNIYGTNDYFDFQRGHVIAALVRRFVDAHKEGVSAVTLWGTGETRREFIHVDDVAEAIVFLMECCDTPDPVNVGSSTDITIRDLAIRIANLVGYRGEIRWDPNKPDGMPRKCLDVSRLKGMGFRPQIDLEHGIQRTVAEYLKLKS